MAIFAGVGISKNIDDPKQAGFEAATKAIEQMGGGKPDFTVAFSSVAFNQDQVVTGIREASNSAPGIGCSDAGAITADGPSTKSVAVMAIKSDQIEFTTGLGRDVKKNAKFAGRAVAEDVKTKTKKPLKTFIMLPDVLSGNGADIVRGILEELGQNFPVVSGAVAGAGLSGDFHFAMGVRHGWVPIGHPMKVTKSEGAVVYTLDNRPAVSIYEDYFGTKADELRKEPLARMAITYPLGIKIPDMEEYLIRDPITVDEKGAITCAAEIPEGSEIRLMIGSKEKAIEAAEEAAHKVMKDLQADKSAPKFVLMFNCIAREKLFAQKAKEEIDAVKKIIGADVPMLCFYTYGEQAPLG